MNLFLPQIRHDQAGFEALSNLWVQTSGSFFDLIEIDMSKTSWLDADMCAALGAILHRLQQNLNTIKLQNIRPEVERILSKNGFLSHYGGEAIPDTWGTTIPYQRFDTKDERYFSDYIQTRLLRRAEMPALSPGLMKKIHESVFEIFSNAALHAQTEQGVFCCGQFFPKRNCLDFCLVDLGIGIRQNIKDNIGLDLTPEQAIVWATEGRNTTKRGPIPGGLGLKLLREFVGMNDGRIRIVSDAGYWLQARGNVHTARLSHPFPGTVVNIEINTADTQAYALTTELTTDDIF